MGALDAKVTRVVLKNVPRSFRMASAAFGVSGTWRRTAAMSCSMSIRIVITSRAVAFMGSAF